MRKGPVDDGYASTGPEHTSERACEDESGESLIRIAMGGDDRIDRLQVRTLRRVRDRDDKVAADRDKLAKKLDNPGFRAKAEPSVIEETEERVREAGAELARLDAALARIAS